ncbi:MAG: O-antigen ligase family protein, partial [Synergistes sp.]|nr:O-antigen ligase family protein [Synergistes sp.]
YGKFGIWPLTETSFSTGAILCCLIVWMIYRLFAEEAGNKIVNAVIFCFFVLTLLTIFLTFRRTFWLAVIVELLTAALVFLFASKKKFFGFIKGMAVLCGAFLILFSLLFVREDPAFAGLLKEKWGQITSIGNNEVTKFTSYRNYVWRDAVSFIKERPLTGYGYAEYDNYTKTFEWYRIVGHSHSTYLQMAWTAGIFPCALFIALLIILLYICITELKKRGLECAFPFAVLLILAGFAASGIFEELFKNARRATTLYWVFLSLPLSKAFLLSTPSENKMKTPDGSFTAA